MIRKAVLLIILAIVVVIYFYPDKVLDPLAARKRGTLDTLFRTHIESSYFVFHSNLPDGELEEFARIADMLIECFNRDFFEIDYKFPLHAYVLPDLRTFQSFLRNNMGDRNPPDFGIYVPSYKAFVTYKDSGLGTMAHEIMHPLVDSSLKAAPKWAVEGIPSFTEKFFGYERNGTLHIEWGYQNPWRIQELGSRLATLDLGEIIRGVHDTSEERLVSVFIYQHGKWREFLDLIKNNEKNGYDTFLEAAFGMPLSEIEPLWRAYLQDIVNNKTAIYRIPASTIFETESEFNDLIASLERGPSSEKEAIEKDEWPSKDEVSDQGEPPEKSQPSKPSEEDDSLEES